MPVCLSRSSVPGKRLIEPGDAWDDGGGEEAESSFIATEVYEPKPNNPNR
jgi:hypothetical protein